MKTKNKQPKLIDKLRLAWTQADSENKRQIEALGKDLMKIQEQCVTFLISFKHRDASKTITPF